MSSQLINLAQLSEWNPWKCHNQYSTNKNLFLVTTLENGSCVAEHHLARSQTGGSSLNWPIIIVPCTCSKFEDFGSSTVFFNTVLKMEICITLNNQDESKRTIWAVIKGVHCREENDDLCLMISSFPFFYHWHKHDVNIFLNYPNRSQNYNLVHTCRAVFLSSSSFITGCSMSGESCSISCSIPLI